MLISCGTNDIEYKSGIEVHTELMSLIKFINEKYSTLKIIISHIIPRKDDLNKEVLVCNGLLDQSGKQSEHVFLVDHSNLQVVRQSILHDTKYIKKESIRHLAGNIKRTLRSSYGIAPIATAETRSNVSAG